MLAVALGLRLPRLESGSLRHFGAAIRPIYPAWRLACFGRGRCPAFVMAAVPYALRAVTLAPVG